MFTLFNKKNRKKEIILLVIFAVVIIAIAITLYIGYFQKPSTSLTQEVYIPIQTTFKIDIANSSFYSDLQTYGDLPIDVSKIQTGRNNPFISY